MMYYILCGGMLEKDKWERDRFVTRTLHKGGYKVIRFWQSDIDRNVGKCVDIILSQGGGDSGE